MRQVRNSHTEPSIFLLTRRLDGSKRRKRSSQPAGCPFRLGGYCRDGKWTLKVLESNHTGHRSEDPIAFPKAR